MTNGTSHRSRELLSRGRLAALEQLERTAQPLEEEPMKRYIHPIPTPVLYPQPTQNLDWVMEAMARQNQLLVDLLGAVNALTAAVLAIQNRLPNGT